MSGMNIGTKKGETRLVLGDVTRCAVVLVRLHPADAATDDDAGALGRGELPFQTGLRDRLVRRGERELVRTDLSAAPPCVSIYRSGSNPLTSQAKRTDSFCGSNFVIGAAPGVPASSAVQVDSTSVPTGVTSRGQ